MNRPPNRSTTRAGLPRALSAQQQAMATQQADLLARRIHGLYARQLNAHPDDTDGVPIPAWDDATPWHRRALVETAMALLRGENP